MIHDPKLAQVPVIDMPLSGDFPGFVVARPISRRLLDALRMNCVRGDNNTYRDKYREDEKMYAFHVAVQNHGQGSE